MNKYKGAEFQEDGQRINNNILMQRIMGSDW